MSTTPQQQLFAPEASAIMPVVGIGFIAFAEFASGDWPFKGSKTPTNPHPVGSEARAEWQRGYDGALTEWFL